MSKMFRCDGMVTKPVTMYVKADSAEEAWRKINDGDLEYEMEGDPHDVDMDRLTMREAKIEDFRAKKWADRK